MFVFVLKQDYCNYQEQLSEERKSSERMNLTDDLTLFYLESS